MERKIDRFLQFLDNKGINENTATRECNLAQGLLHQAKIGKADLGHKSIEKILIKYQDLNRNWLLTGEGEMILNGIHQNISGNGNTAVAGNGNTVQSYDVARALDKISEQLKLTSKAVDEISEQRKLAAKAQEQIDRLLSIIEKQHN